MSMQRPHSPEALRTAACRLLLELSYEHGFHYFPLSVLAESLSVRSEALYDNDTNTGVLWSLGPHGEGALDVTSDGTAIGIPRGETAWIERVIADGS